MSRVADESRWASGAEGAAEGRSRRRLIAAGGAIAVVAAATFTVTRLTSGSGSHLTVGTGATTTATLRRTNLVQTTPVNGTVGFASLVPGGSTPVSIVQPGGSPPSELAQAEESVTSAQQSLTADRQAADDATAGDAQNVAEAQQSLSTAQATASSDTTQLETDEATLVGDQQKEASGCQGSGSAACPADAAQVASDEKAVSVDRRTVASDQAAVSSSQGQLTSTQLKAAQDHDENQARLNADGLNISKARSTAADAQTSETVYDQSSKYTALPVAGQVIAPGQPLWSVDGDPVVLLPGTLSPWRAFTSGMTAGADVAALNRALVDLGDGSGLTAAASFTDATTAAIDRLQASLGLPQTGMLPLGSVLFAPTAVRVTAVHPQVGGPVAAGAPVLDVTSTIPVINVALPVDESYLVKVDDPVSVTLPDGSTTDGTISAVGTVATSATPSSGSPSTSPTATINVTVVVRGASGALSLDQAPVTVNITNGTATNVLAVPTTALLSLAGGGYAVELVAADGTHRLVPVSAGLFDDQAGMVEVSGVGLGAGQKVVAAA